MRGLEIFVEKAARPYTGRELRSLFAFQTYGVQGDSAVAFVGPARVGPETMVDLEDIRREAWIESRLMLHLLVEHFEEGLTTTVLRQRLLVRVAADRLVAMSGRVIEVSGDDLFFDRRKLSVSIATCSPISGLIHLGLNVTGVGAPVPAAGLEELELSPEVVAGTILEAYRDECEDVLRAARKTRWVK